MDLNVLNYSAVFLAEFMNKVNIKRWEIGIILLASIGQQCHTYTFVGNDLASKNINDKVLK